MELLHNYIFIPLDIFRKKHQNENISTELDAWLTFLSTEEPDEIMRLCDAYPFFRDIYKHIYEICQNTEDVMGIFSEALAELDRNTVDYMIDELKRSNEQLQDKNELLEDRIQHLQKELDDMRKLLREQSEQ
jgi:hypothetical protein